MPSGRYHAPRAAARGAVHERGSSWPGCSTRPSRPSRGWGATTCALLVADRATGALAAHPLRELPQLLAPGDLLVVNTSATLPAALPARARRAEPLDAAPLDAGSGDERWVVELRARATQPPLRDAVAGARLELPGGAARRGRSRRTPAAGGWSWRALELGARRSTAYLRRARPRRSATRYVRASLAARRLPDRLRARARQRGDAERRPAVHAGARDGARGRRRRSSPRSSCTPACPRRSAASRPTPSASAVSGRRPPGS